jgi:very-short-patch-repair endonuclease
MPRDRSWKSASDNRRDPARALRKSSTYPERRLWRALRAGRLAGLQFRRQHLIGPYVADFYCHEHALVIELDGRSHIGRYDADIERQQDLEARGLRVLRIGNDDVLDNLDGILEGIARADGLGPSAPSP